MRFLSIAVLATFFHAAYAADLYTANVKYAVPDGLSLVRQLSINTNQYRGEQGEVWVINEIKLSSIQPDDQSKATGAIDRSENKMRKEAAIYKGANVPHRLERKSLKDGATLLLLGSQQTRTGGAYPPKGIAYSVIEFNVYWKNNFSQLAGRIEWQGELNEKFGKYLAHIETLKRESD